MLIAMAGLPGAGKSAIAERLGRKLNGLVLNKDEIRAELFPSYAINFSQEQDDLCMEVIFIAAKYLLRAKPGQTIIIDGRTFSKSYQIEHLISHSASLTVKPIIIECICDDAVAKQRLDHDQRIGAHPAGTRTYNLYLELKEKAEPITAEHLVLDTSFESLETSVHRCIDYVEPLRQEQEAPKK